MAKKFVYTITTGRSGTNYLADLFKANIEDAKIYHERANFVELGRRSPDASHFTHFNTFGNTRDIAQFWKQKLSDDTAEVGSAYVETSHLLSKAGLFENYQK